MTDLSPRAMADVVVDAAGDKKAEDILVLNVSELTTIADLFVICTGRGERQVQAIADAVREKAIEAGRRPIGVEGYNAGRWVLIDLGAVVSTPSSPKSASSTVWSACGVTLRSCFASLSALALATSRRVPLVGRRLDAMGLGLFHVLALKRSHETAAPEAP